MEETLDGSRRWDLALDHRQELGRNWTAGASGDFRSDATYASDANQSIQESLNRSLHSQVWLRGRWSGLSTGVTLDRREELDEDTVSELLPKVEVTASQRPLLSVPEGTGGIRGLLGEVSYSWDAKVVNDRDRADGETTVHQGAGLGLSLRTSQKIMGWLGVSPHASLTQNWYDRDRSGTRFPSRFTYGAGVSTSTTIYGTFLPRRRPARGREAHHRAVRHVRVDARPRGVLRRGRHGPLLHVQRVREHPARERGRERVPREQAAAQGQGRGGGPQARQLPQAVHVERVRPPRGQPTAGPTSCPARSCVPATRSP